MASIPGTKQPTPRTGGDKPAASGETKPTGSAASNPTREKSDAPVAQEPGKVTTETVKETGLSFEDMDDLPSGNDLELLTNPWAEKVNELAISGKATKFQYDADQKDYALNKIRRAANAINKGAKTKVFPVEGNPDKVWIWFKVGEMARRPRRTK